MKKLLLTSFITLISFNLSAIEHVVGLSVGYSNTSSNAKHYQIEKYNKESSSVSISYSENNKHKNISGMNFDLEYQARWNMISLGAGYLYNQTSHSINYTDLKSINYKNNVPYILAMTKFLETQNMVFRLGVTLGPEVTITNCKSYLKIHDSIFVDGEYNINNNFMVFSRASFLYTSGNHVECNTNVLINIPKDDVKEIDNYIKGSLRSQYKINFGVRYKIQS